MAEIKLPAYAWLAPIAGLVFAGMGLVSGGSPLFALIPLIVGGLLFFFGKRGQMKQRQELAAKLDAELKDALQALGAVLAELASYRRNWTIAHTAALDVEEILRSISLADTLYQGPQDEPAVLLNGPAAGLKGHEGAVLAEKFAVWDLVPPPALVHPAPAATAELN